MDDPVKSRTQKKNDDRALQKVGEQLVALSLKQLQQMDMEPELLVAIRLARKTKSHEARRRQIQYIGALMREMDVALIQKALENIQLGDFRSARAFKTMEQWRDAIKAGNTHVIEGILRRCPKAERQRLTQLARNARKNAQTGKEAKSSRALMRYLKEIWDGEKQ